jgi:hypothetical protein
VGEGIARNRFNLAFFDSANVSEKYSLTTGREEEDLGSPEDALAASAAAFARPWSASMGALMLDLGRVSSDSSSEEAAVDGTMPYVAYLCGGGAKPGNGGNLAAPVDPAEPAGVNLLLSGRDGGWTAWRILSREDWMPMI